MHHEMAVVYFFQLYFSTDRRETKRYRVVWFKDRLMARTILRRILTERFPQEQVPEELKILGCGQGPGQS